MSQNYVMNLLKEVIKLQLKRFTCWKHAWPTCIFYIKRLVYVFLMKNYVKNCFLRWILVINQLNFNEIGQNHVIKRKLFNKLFNSPTPTCRNQPFFGRQIMWQDWHRLFNVAKDEFCYITCWKSLKSSLFLYTFNTFHQFYSGG